MQPVFSTRVSMKWSKDKEPTETTSTWVFTASNGEFVDIRIDVASKEPQWLITGKEVEIPTKTGYEFSVEFQHQLDSLGGDSGADVGNFTSLPDGDRLEAGEMFNHDIGEVMGYEEVWRSLDPVNSTPTQLVRENGGAIASSVWEFLEGHGTKSGKFITIESFGQGVVYYAGQYQCVRLFGGKIVYQYGEDAPAIFAKFTNDLDGKSDFKWAETFRG